MVTKKKTKFFKSLRFRIFIILIILGIVPGIIVTQLMIHYYENQAVEVSVSAVRTECAILCDQIIKENYLNDSSSEAVNSKLELLSNVYGGRILVVDRDFKIVRDTYHVEEGRTLVSSKVIRCFKNGDSDEFKKIGQMIELVVPVKSADVSQVQGAMLVNISGSEIAAIAGDLEQKGILIICIIIVLSLFLAYILSTVLVKPLARVTKAIEDLTDGYQQDEISVPDYTETELITDAFNKMLARMKVLDESRSEFVSNVSHELKTPLTSISGYAELMENNLVDGENVVNFASAIHKNADRLLTLINDIIRLSELDGVQAAPEFEELDLYAIVQNCVQTLQVNARNHNVSISAKGTGQLIKANRQMIEELVYNLCDNAIRYNKEGGKVEAGVARTREGVQLIVQDNGIGIPKEHQERIFERFYRVDKSRSKETGGTGLGLAIVKHIAQVHNASLEVISEEGQGTKILVTFHA